LRPRRVPSRCRRPRRERAARLRHRAAGLRDGAGDPGDVLFAPRHKDAGGGDVAGGRRQCRAQVPFGVGIGMGRVRRGARHLARLLGECEPASVPGAAAKPAGVRRHAAALAFAQYPRRRGNRLRGIGRRHAHAAARARFRRGACVRRRRLSRFRLSVPGPLAARTVAKGMIRLFVALALPDSVAQTLMMLEYGVPGARWQEREQLHLTLRFIGEVDGRDASGIDDALSAISAPRFSLQLKGVGEFGGKTPRALWAGVAPNEALMHLNRKIETALQRLGLEAEQRKFTPHVTLARLKATSRGRVMDYL